MRDNRNTYGMYVVGKNKKSGGGGECLHCFDRFLGNKLSLMMTVEYRDYYHMALSGPVAGKTFFLGHFLVIFFSFIFVHF